MTVVSSGVRRQGGQRNSSVSLPPRPLVVAGLSVFRDSKPCLRSCLDSFCHHVDGVLILDGPDFTQDERTPDDGTRQVISECAARFDPMNVKRSYYRDHPQRFVVEEMKQWYDPKFKSQPVTRRERMQILVQEVRAGNFLLLVNPDEVFVGDLAESLEIVRSSAPDDDCFYVQVMPSGLWEMRLVRVAPELSFSDDGRSIQFRDSRGGGRRSFSAFTSVEDVPPGKALSEVKIYQFGSAQSCMTNDITTQAAPA